jgi:hypothetical protein
MSRFSATRQEAGKPTAFGQSTACGRAHPDTPIIIPRKGLNLQHRITYEKWLTIGRQLSEIYTSSAWCLGDWLVYGEATYNGRYREAIEQTSLDYQTLRNYAWVVKRFPLSRRRDRLSFGHHAEVAALAEPEQDFWLHKAEEFSWSVKQLRREVRASLKERSDGTENRVAAATNEGYPQRYTVRLEIDLSPDQLETCQAAADRAGLSIEAWMFLALERAVTEAH